MAITIRNIENHEEMLADLKALTDTPTTSKALIKAGYVAIEYSKKYKREQQENRRLREEVEQLNRKIEAFNSAFKNLTN